MKSQNQNLKVLGGTRPGSRWHAQQAGVLETRHEGLTGEEVSRRQKTFGPDRVTARRGSPAWMKFLQQFNHAPCPALAVREREHGFVDGSPSSIQA